MQLFISVLMAVFSGLLLAALTVTSECRWMVRRNVRRSNGSISWNRLRREAAAYGNYVTSLAVPLVLSVPAGLLLADYLNARVMPLNQMATAVQQVTVSSGDSAKNLRAIQKEHTEWMKRQSSASDQEIHNLQKTLWYGWPLFASAAASVVLLLFWLLLGFSKSAVHDYVTGVRARRKSYDRLDVIAMQTIVDARPV